MSIQSLNPATEEVVASFNPLSEGDLQNVLNSTAESWTGWKSKSFSERAGLLKKAADQLRAQSEELAEIMAVEMGKPIRMGKEEALKCAAVCDYYADEGESMLAPIPVEGVGRKAFVTFEPLGTVLTVMPWNFPFWQVFRIAAPSLMAGNTVVLKHASNVPQCALAIEKIFVDAGFPANVFRTLLIGASQVETVLDHKSVFAVSLTGSAAAGRKVASAAGARLKKSVMELGGSDPLVVLADADIEEAVKVATKSRCRNTGQTCISAKRFIVMDEVYDEFVSGLTKRMSRLVMGDPFDPKTDMGPMSSGRLRAELQEQVDRCVEAGGKILIGGSIPKRTGYYYPPTIITDISPSADVCKEELFGPVALVFRVHSVDEAVAVANDTPFGLGGSVWSKDEDAAAKVAARIRTGCVYINSLVRSNMHLPFGGTGISGYGRELGSYGIREFVNVKPVCIG
ncbi:NAD-dependent succinate-semialdehyde dehydrogenase [Desulfovibrio gilichinskyi]|uniref:Succinate-semialdehyde dehydrogenase / glutarate-semialdehyde dehydrogenase n=1 Tax=Desulfovibrio gilichinskyi TaxID=1519643 RepID=A0A1X7DR83_9BACT|nr:NAD-dependent succinate-semialdehyde dehydrogenase [Desulfovibrio gilichinskyi]SMF20047.1 succinate-semialdehyde dehydrogenase / glutarate-semialdehyde dehydrogenase [Desulfovibrio gilichinskyi]